MPSRSQDEAAVELSEVLRAEFETLHSDRYKQSFLASPRQNSYAHYYSEVHKLPGAGQSALCLSGGGIRSAAFSLGIIQGLARRGVLPKLHYLSTVSGGGYTGAWLTAWLHRETMTDVMSGLGPWQAQQVEETKALRWLRIYHSFLTPKVGFASADTWTAMILIVRNLFLNWLVFFPFIFAVLEIPRIFVAFLKVIRLEMETSSSLLAIANLDFHNLRLLLAIANWRSWLDLSGILFIVFAFAISAANRPTRGRSSLTGKQYQKWVLIPGCIGAVLLTSACGYYVNKDLADPLYMKRWLVLGAVIYVISRLLSLFRPVTREARSVRAVMYELIAWAVAGGVAGGVMWGGLVLLQGNETSPDGIDATYRALSVCGFPLVVLSFLAGEAIYVGISSRFENGDRDREWLARAAGLFSAVATSWLVISALVVYAPNIWEAGGKFYDATIAASGIVTLLSGASSFTAATAKAASKERIPISTVTTVISAVFVLCGIVLVAHILRIWLSAIAPIWSSAASQLLSVFGVNPAVAAYQTDISSPSSELAFLTSFVVTLIIFSRLMSQFVNVNWFSLHAVYRNRLIKTFLGATNKARDRNPFDGFSDSDNIKFENLRSKGKTPLSMGLFPIINVSLNIVATRKLAWQDRKAESFVFTPLHAGNPTVKFRSAKLYASDVTLGTAMAISGAAVSPNWGYHSSSLTSVIMMLFNLRLGWWLGNPKHASTWHQNGPRSAGAIFVQEALGRTSDDEKYIYLSDGGHFENLGLYEMIRRRCRSIIVIDAGADHDCTLEDLGNAVRKVHIDMGVMIKFSNLQLAKRSEPPLPGFYCALGQVIYPEQPDSVGKILYIKPGLRGNEPADIKAYAAANARFPHDSTINQWFTEPQFESYRALGSFILDEICLGPNWPPHLASTQFSLEQFFEAIERYLANSNVSR